MNTETAAQATATYEYRVTLVDTAGKWHTITIHRDGWRGVKTAARKVAKDRGIEVKFIDDFYVAS